MDDKIYYQDLTDMRRRMTAIETNLEAVRKTVSMDERESIDTLRNLITATAAQVHTNSKLWNEAYAQRSAPPEEIYLNDNTFREILRRTEEQRKKDSPAYQERVSYLRTLAFESSIEMLDQVCECGQHYALRVVRNTKEQEIVEDSICPQRYWLLLSQAHNLQNNLIKFLRDLPLHKFLGWYERDTNEE